MKNIFIGLLLMVSQTIFAQVNNFCGTNEGRSEWLKQYQKNPSAYEKRNNDTIFMPMTVHIVGNDDGTGFYSFANFLEDFCTLNKDFAPSKIQFYLASPVKYIKNTVWNNHKTFGDGIGVYDNNVENTVNSYIVASAAGNCGYDWPGTGIVLAKGCMGKFNHTWAHEMGHELSLPHTFVGWEGVDYNSNLGAPSEVNGNEVELLDKSNCADAADGFCDTEADYYSNRWSCGSDRKGTSLVKDPTGVAFKIRGDYFMSYSNDACMDKFSAEQIGAMRAHALSEKNEFVNTQNTNPPTIGFANAIFPKDSSVMETSFTLQWSKVKNASNYFVEISRANSFSVKDFVGTINDTSLTVNLLAGKKYFWRVRAYNLSYSCGADIVKKQYFFTKAISDNEDIFSVQKFVVFPNPSQTKSILHTEFEATSNENATLILTDLSGKILWKKAIQIQQGENRHDISIDLASGFYFLNIKTNKGIRQEKMVILE